MSSAGASAGSLAWRSRTSPTTARASAEAWPARAIGLIVIPPTVIPLMGNACARGGDRAEAQQGGCQQAEDHSELVAQEERGHQGQTGGDQGDDDGRR